MRRPPLALALASLFLALAAIALATRQDRTLVTLTSDSHSDLASDGGESSAVLIESDEHRARPGYTGTASADNRRSQDAQEGRAMLRDEPIERDPVPARRPRTDEDCAAIASTSPFFVDSQAVIPKIERELRVSGDTAIADKLRDISCYPYATWLTWKDASYMRAYVERVSSASELAGKIPVFVLYNSPDHTTAKWWTGNNGDDYLNWVREVGQGVGGGSAWFIVEPDAIGLSTHYAPSEQAYRLRELSSAVAMLKKAAPHARVYLDGGHSAWKDAETFAALLGRAGIRTADGFALNISNYQELEAELSRGRELSRLLGGVHFVIDTSRNGNGAPADNEWCNATGRALGEHPTMDTADPLADAFLWIKPPGESDGTCNGGPPAGEFSLERALSLIEGARVRDD